MNTHPYLRAYMAGIAFPTMFLLVILAGFTVIRLGFEVPIPVERAIVFPMAFVPNLWGLWNMLYLRLQSRRWISLGAHGALLPLILMPLGFALASVLLPPIEVPAAFVVLFLAVAVGAYYLVWKLAVGFFNQVLGIA